ncbi:MAG: hypothetical protein LKK00_08165, partial [Intestinimonas sp.]|nr:hypothetical protein [Intestinimonas sp.]
MSNTMQNWVLPYSLGCIAFEGDNLSHRLEITTDAAAEWQFKLDLKLGNTANVIDLTREGDLLYVDLTSDMTAEPGEYQAQLRGISGDKVRHSTVSVLYIGQSVNAINGFPATEPSEMAQMETRITVLKEAAEVAQKKSEMAQSAAETAATSAADAADSAKAAVDVLPAKADQPYQSSSRTDGGWYCADSAGGAPKEISLAGNSVQDG